MSKINLPPISSAFNSQTRINNNFDAIEDEFQNKVLYRDNPNGEPNSMQCNLDMNGFYVLNAANWPTSAGNGSSVEIVVPEDFGAKGDGLTDDTQAFIDAFAYIKERIAAFNWNASLTSSLQVRSPVFVEFNGNNRQYRISDELWISDGFTGLIMRNFSLVASENDWQSPNDGKLTFDHNTGYISLSGTIKGMIRIGKTSKVLTRDNVFENITLDCKLQCDGILSYRTAGTAFNNIDIVHHKRYGMRFWGKGENTGHNLQNITANQYYFGEAPNYTPDGIGISVESADMTFEDVNCGNNRVGMYFHRFGGFTVGKNHHYNHYPDSTDPAVFPAILDITNSSVTNASSTGMKMRVTTETDHSLTAGDLVYAGWYPGVSENGGVAGKWSSITIINSTTFDMDETTFAGTYQKGKDTVTFTGGGSNNIIYTDQDNASVGAKVTFTSTGSLPSEIVEGTKYIVKSVNAGANTFTIAEGSLGAVTKTFATTGSGVHSVYWRGWQNRVKTQEKQPISMWIAPSVQFFKAIHTELESSIRNYSRSPQFIGVMGSATADAVRTGYPWFDHRVIIPSDNLDGIMLSNVTLLGGMGKASFYAQGAGSIVEPVKCVVTNLLQKSGNSGDSRGYQEILFTAAVTPISPTGYTSNQTGSIIVDGDTISLAVTTSTNTLQKLISYIEGAVAAADLDVDVNGWVRTSNKTLRFTSQNIGSGSTVRLSGGIFTNLQSYSKIQTAVDGVTDEVSFGRMPELTQLIARQGNAYSPSITFTSLGTDVDGAKTSIDIGTGIFSDINKEIAFSNNSIETMRLDDTNNVIIGDGQVEKTATDGYLYLPEVSLTAVGVPTGVPTTYSGRSPMVVGTNNRLYVYVNGSWKYTTLT